jgi:uncharacterized protein YbjT (DUF2867 family)
VAGATGLVGREILALLLADKTYAAVHSVGRRLSPLEHPKLTQHVVDFAALPALPVADDVFIALGTTIKVAGSQAAFKAVDFDAVVAVAQQIRAWAAIKSIANKNTNSSSMQHRIGVVSAMGADATSSVFYNRVKGEMEAAVGALGYSSTVFARPSMLAGDRASLQQASRQGEQIGLTAMHALDALIPANYKAIEAQQVAKALVHGVQHAARGITIALSGQLRKV